MGDTDKHDATQSSGLSGTARAPPSYTERVFMPAQIIKESMRMFPVGGSGIGRYADRDIDLGGYLIPKGTEVALCLHTMQMVPWNFPQPTRFDLDRWLEGEGTAPHALLACPPRAQGACQAWRHALLAVGQNAKRLIISTVCGASPVTQAAWEGSCRVHGSDGGV